MANAKTSYQGKTVAKTKGQRAWIWGSLRDYGTRPAPAFSGISVIKYKTREKAEEMTDGGFGWVTVRLEGTEWVPA